MYKSLYFYILIYIYIYCFVPKNADTPSVNLSGAEPNKNIRCFIYKDFS